MQKTMHRPCAICITGHFKCSPNSQAKTCSITCAKIYATEARKFYGFTKGWHKANDVPAYKNAPVQRVGNILQRQLHA